MAFMVGKYRFSAMFFSIDYILFYFHYIGSDLDVYAVV